MNLPFKTLTHVLPTSASFLLFDKTDWYVLSQECLLRNSAWPSEKTTIATKYLITFSIPGSKFIGLNSYGLLGLFFLYRYYDEKLHSDGNFFVSRDVFIIFNTGYPRAGNTSLSSLICIQNDRMW